MADLSGQIGELRMVLEIKRKETGETPPSGTWTPQPPASGTWN